MTDRSDAVDAVDALQRWSDAGAVWRVLERRDDALVIGLYRCDGGEEVDRIVSTDPALRTFVDDRDDSES
ncbi:hypothetical protein [Gordonia sp. (in: high G+C Gram-positive bacteria)]|uniref:hypothetical protein n=1 Tax=Gordonia sp. (in: high G+C Gram-positive bacteria) TaxID=84139 RepID=UPI0039E2CC04